jgi:hypothetical protein
MAGCDRGCHDGSVFGVLLLDRSAQRELATKIRRFARKPVLDRGWVLLVACLGVALVLDVGARSASRPPPVAFGTPVEIGYALAEDSIDDIDSMAIGDLNGDRRPDLVLTSANFGTVALVFNRGGGRFRAGPFYNVGRPPGPVAIADVNGDGKQDVVAGGGDVVFVFLNHGDGTLLPPVVYPAGHADLHASLAVGDLNGDGHPDLVTAGSPVSSVSVLLNHGDGTFDAPVAYPTRASAFAVAIGDLNGDAKPDLVVTVRTHHVAVLFNAGDGSFAVGREYGTGTYPYAVALADFNGDHKLDVATSNGPAVGVSVLLNKGDGSLAPKHDFRGYGPLAGDLNGDGKPDLIGTGVLLNRGDGSLEPELSHGPRNGSAVAIGDLNGDRRLDIVESTLDERNGQYDLFMLLNAPRACDVQPVRRETVAAASTKLALAACRVGKVSHAYSTKAKRGLVLSQRPGSGAVLRKGGRVALVVSLGPKR